jgi:thiol:disulfide interchange protein/DsbC/DsbD-like thiol-disulfide interchange protein
MSLRMGRFIPAHRHYLPILIALVIHLVSIQSSFAKEVNHTRARLVCDVSGTVPGSTVTLGVLLQMDPGWHTYWENSGESGLATSVRWTLPEGFTVSGLQWPIPDKKIEPGDVLTYGYAGEVMLLATMHIPQSTHLTMAKIQAEVSWLECEKTCVPGEATLSLELPLAREARPSPDAGSIASSLARLPRPPAGARDVSLTVTTTKDSLSIEVVPLSGVSLRNEVSDLPDFYPVAESAGYVGRTTTTPAHGGVRISMPLLAQGTDPHEIRGILVYTLSDGSRHGIELSHTPGKEGSLLDRNFIIDRPTGGEASLIVYLGLALLGGLLLNIMPCVLPVIALKVFGLVKMAGDEPQRVRRLGWMFSLGILASFLVLALLVIVLKVAGQQVGWGFQFQEPLFVIGMSALVFAFGLSLFGVFEIRLPGVAVSGVSTMISQQEQKGGRGYAASFAEGVFATILATPCTAPFLGTALGFAFAQPMGIILLIFSVVALGMALPYLVITARPTWQRFLPKPGAWMETAKQFMGFFMMATLLWLLYVLGKQLGMEGVIWTAAFLLTVGMGCWLIGRFATLTASRAKVWTTWVVALLLVVGGYVVFISSILDVQAAIAGPPALTTSGGETANGDVVWESFSPALLEGHLQRQQPVLLDFTAEWCLTCKVNEKTIIADQHVQEKLRSSGIVTIKADWTNRNPDITKLLAKFGRSGVPLYVVFPAGRPNEPIILPEVLTTGILLDALERAIATH